VGEVTTIYVLPQAFGQGIGRELMRAALTTMTEAGYVEATLWVLADNERAIAFYGAGGWQPDGSRKQDTIAGVPVTEIRYRHALAV
jgi:ribosomal protein S18 acetylase RimI-like enzyme